MTDEPSAAASAAPDSTPAAATAVPAANPVENPAGNAAAPSAEAPASAAPADDFDENLIPESSRENFKKYRESQQKKQKDYDDRLNQVTREKYEYEARLRQIQQQQARPADLKDIGEAPKLEDPQFKTIEDYTKAVSDYYKKVGAAEYREQTTRAEQQRSQMAEAAKAAAKGQAAMQKYSDFRQVVEPLIPVANQMPVLDQFVKESDSGTDVLYHLCKNPALLEGLMKMTPFAAGKELIRLETLIAAQPVKSTTKAPAPMTPVGGGDGNVTKLLDLAKKEDASDYVTRRNREELRRKKGLN